MVRPFDKEQAFIDQYLVGVGRFARRGWQPIMLICKDYSPHQPYLYPYLSESQGHFHRQCGNPSTPFTEPELISNYRDDDLVRWHIVLDRLMARNGNAGVSGPWFSI